MLFALVQHVECCAFCTCTAPVGHACCTCTACVVLCFLHLYSTCSSCFLHLTSTMYSTCWCQAFCAYTVTHAAGTQRVTLSAFVGSHFLPCRTHAGSRFLHLLGHIFCTGRVTLYDLVGCQFCNYATPPAAWLDLLQASDECKAHAVAYALRT